MVNESQRITQKLFERKLSCIDVPPLDKELVRDFLERVMVIICPMRARINFGTVEELADEISKLEKTLELILVPLHLSEDQRKTVVRKLFDSLDSLAEKVDMDAKALYESDPAAENLAEVVLSYPGLFAVTVYRIANVLYESGSRVLARVLSEIAHEKTGIEIHPAASIGDSFVIDHGTGVVIGETAEVGNNVIIYQGVTLGALSVKKKYAKKKRHPTIEGDCVIYAHATILGGNTVIGKGSVIGGNVWVTKSIPANSLVYHKSEVKLDTKLSSSTQELTYEI